MKRLTCRADFGLEEWEETLLFVKSDPYEAYDIIDIAKQQGNTEFDEILKSVSLRLADIEDIISDENGEYDLDLIAELIKAKRDGRCVILPCKHGDTVWFIKSAFSVACFPIEAKHVSVRGIDCDGDVLYAAITIYNGIERRFKKSDIGKTVFLTREAAEQALKEYKDGRSD